MKKVLSLILVFVLSLGMVSFASAEEVFPEDRNDYSAELIGLEGTEKLSRWVYTSATSQAVYVNSAGRLTGSATVTGHSDVTKIVCYMYPQQLVNGAWKNLATYTDTAYNRALGAEHYYSTCPSGYYYRIRTSYYVYVGDTYEHIIAYSGNYYH